MNDLRLRFVAVMLVALLLVVSQVSPLAKAAPTYKTTYVFVIDTSLSMIGQASGAVDIMPKVKGALKDYLKTSPETFVGARIVVATFSDRLETINEFPIQDKSSLEKVTSFVDSVKAAGRSTMVSKSMREVFSGMSDRRSPDESVYFYIYTDGLEEEPGKTISDMVKEFRAVKQSRDWLYYIALGVAVPPADRSAFTQSEQASIVLVPGGQKPPSIIDLTIPRLNFGDLADKVTREQVFSPKIRLSSLAGLKISFKTEDAADLPYARSKGADIAVVPAETNYADRIKLSLSAVNKENLPPGIYTLKCSAETSSPDFIVNNRTFDIRFSNGDISYIVSTGKPDVTGSKPKMEIAADRVWERAFSSSMTMVFTPSALAQKFDSSLPSLEASLEMASSQASGFVSFDKPGSQKKSAVIPASGGELTAAVGIPKGTTAGRYQGKVRVFSSDAPLKGPLVKDLGDSFYEIPFSVVVAKRPMPMAAKALVVLLTMGGLLIAAVFITASLRRLPVNGVVTDWGAALGLIRPSLRNVTLQCVEPRTSRLTHEFPSLRDERIGTGTDLFPEMGATLRFRAVIHEGRRALVVTGEGREGVFGLKRVGERDCVPQHEARVWADDIIQVGKYRFRIDSNDLLGGGADVE